MTPPTTQIKTTIVRPEIKLKADILLKQEISLRITELEEEKKKIDSELSEMLVTTGQKDEKGRLYLTTDEHLLRLMEKAGRKTLSREKLLAAGVPIDTLSECMDVGKRVDGCPRSNAALGSVRI